MSDPILIDAATFTAEQGVLQGILALKELDRRVWSHELLACVDNEVNYHVAGGVDRWQRPFLDITIEGQLDLVCQRCLKPVAYLLQDKAHVVFFADERQMDEAMMADELLEGVLLTPEINLTVLLEDQLLMSIPFTPRHEDCENTPITRINQDKNHPFAQLAALKSSH